MRSTGHDPDSAEDLYENAPCGYLSSLLDGQVAKVNTTLLSWLGYTRDQLVGRRYFSDLLTVGGRLYYETNFAPLLSMQGQVGGVALELRAADGILADTAFTGAPGERYGDTGLRSLARRLAPTTAGAAVTAITALLDELSDGLDDDTAVLAISIPSPA